MKDLIGNLESVKKEKGLYGSLAFVSFQGCFRLKANQDGLCLGLIQWMKIKLYDDIEYENIPYNVQSHWSTPVYVFDEPIELKKGQFLDIKGFLAKDSVWFNQVN